MEVFKDYALYYNMFYKNKDYRKEAENVQNLLTRYAVNNIKNILNIGCGTGKHDIELNQLGYCVHGIDLSKEMINIAQQDCKGTVGLEFEVGDARLYRTRKKYDAVCSLFHVMSYQNKTEDVLQVMKSAYEALDASGLFLFDVWYGPGVLTERPEVRVKRIEDDKYHILRIATPVMHPNENVVDVCYDILVIEKATGCTKEIKEVHNMRYFFCPEMKHYLECSGFELLGCLDCTSLGSPDYQSWTTYFVARKKI